MLVMVMVMVMVMAMAMLNSARMHVVYVGAHTASLFTNCLSSSSSLRHVYCHKRLAAALISTSQCCSRALSLAVLQFPRRLRSLWMSFADYRTRGAKAVATFPSLHTYHRRTGSQCYLFSAFVRDPQPHFFVDGACHR